jgi:hypothetical protein
VATAVDQGSRGNVLNPAALLAATGLSVDLSGRLDWERSLGYHVGQARCGSICAGVSPGVSCSRGGYEDVRAALRAVFAERLLDPTTGQPVVGSS